MPILGTQIFCIFTSIKNLLTPKKSSCVFWQHIIFAQVHVTRDFHVFGPNFNRSCGLEEYLSYAPNFRTFENMSQKL